MTWVTPSGLTGNAEVIRLSASLLDRRQGDCRQFAAIKLRPHTYPASAERTRYVPWENFPLGVVEQLGTSPGQWLLAQRIARAQDLLESTDLPFGRHRPTIVSA
ncbi:hypothetical protein NE235_27920 [Actinoallomurus spadix]|uniref:Uncharacterized protein n=1 Tax=Actinoallomurus spadix TaxID=79912 RepID=A0ABP3G8S6_9ACTN|nr:hypothetical protein [Actinoallomurus spadix]MCO5989947.1 hypothetical protein [Actinoallomurus spadix]